MLLSAVLESGYNKFIEFNFRTVYPRYYATIIRIDCDLAIDFNELERLSTIFSRKLQTPQHILKVREIADAVYFIDRTLGCFKVVTIEGLIFLGLFSLQEFIFFAVYNSFMYSKNEFRTNDYELSLCNCSFFYYSLTITHSLFLLEHLHFSVDQVFAVIDILNSFVTSRKISHSVPPVIEELLNEKHIDPNKYLLIILLYSLENIKINQDIYAYFGVENTDNKDRLSPKLFIEILKQVGL